MSSTAESAAPVEEQPVTTMRVPTSWLRYALVAAGGLLFGGGGTTGVSMALSEPLSRYATSAEVEQLVDELRDEHDELATSDELSDLLFVVCQLAATVDPPIRDRRCE